MVSVVISETQIINIACKASLKYQRCLNKARKNYEDMHFRQNCKSNAVYPTFIR